MRRITVALLLAALAAAPVSAQTLYLSQDVPTDPGIGVDQLPWEIHSHLAGVYGLEFSVPGTSRIDAVHRLDLAGSWLFSLETPGNLAGALPGTALPADVIRFDGAVNAYDFHFCSGAVVGPVPPSGNVDAVYLEAATGGDHGDLIVSFDVPTTILGTTYDPADLVRYVRTGPGCADFQFGGLVFDASAVGFGIDTGNDLIGADEAPGGVVVLSFDVPADLLPSLGPTTYLPGFVARWDPGTGLFDVFDTLAVWPLSSEVDGLSCQANPGRVPLLLLNRSGITPGDLTLTWAPSCSQGAESHAIYEGTLPNWNSHTMKDCLDDLGDHTEEVTPPVNSSYYLVVPTTSSDEGSYGTTFIGGVTAERAQAATLADRCVELQTLTPCP